MLHHLLIDCVVLLVEEGVPADCALLPDGVAVEGLLSVARFLDNLTSFNSDTAFHLVTIMDLMVDGRVFFGVQSIC